VTLTIVPIPCLRDNYAYLVFRRDGNGECVVVDAAETAPVISEVERRGLRLRGILTTHHHWDHVGGNRELLERERLSVFAHESETERVPGVSNPLSHRERFEIAGIEFSALHVPGHTTGALAYVADGVCFTGDTLFCGGCGRLFEGTPEQMHESLTRTLGELPDETVVYTGHEYTLGNLEFAMGLLPSSELFARHADVLRRREAGAYCASATLGEERATNPFLRCGDPALRAVLGEPGSELAAFGRLRLLKDQA
jgi:hydroxyacylglutathione hydrolase